MQNMSSLAEHIRELEERLLSPEIRTNVAELDRLLADDFFEYGSSGNVCYKKDCVVEGGISVRELFLYDFQIHPLAADAVLATYRIEDRTRIQHTLRSSIWRYRDGRWQMFFHQGTVI